MQSKLYWIIAGVVLIVFVIFETQKEKPTDWTSTYHHEHDLPFGMEFSQDLLATMFDQSEIPSSFRSIYELVNEDGSQANLLIIADEVVLDRNDMKAVLTHVADGHDVLVQAFRFGGPLADTLGISTQEDLSLSSLSANSLERFLGEPKTEEIEETNSGKRFSVPEILSSVYFTDYNQEIVSPLLVSQAEDPLLLEATFGEGRLWVSTMPLSLTNYMVLNEQVKPLAEYMISQFAPEEMLVHSEFYHLGRLKGQSPMRVVLNRSALRNAFYLLLIIFLVLILFRAKRKQRMIPIVQPFKNSSLEFVDTLGQLYYRQSSHTKLAQKRAKFWIDYVYQHFNLRPHQWDKEFEEELILKSGKDKELCRGLIQHFEKVEGGAEITSEELMNIEKKLNEFYGIG